MASKSVAFINDRDNRNKDIGGQLREARVAKGLSMRELARRLDISASALSQIETGKSRPSVETLYAIVSELGLSLDELFSGRRKAEERDEQNGIEETSKDSLASPAVPKKANPGPLQSVEDRASIKLDSGVTWQRLTTEHDASVDFIAGIYEPGGSSSRDERLIRHSGHEYHLLVSGELNVSIGFETFTLTPGDSISFDSMTPHRLFNPGGSTAEVVTFVVGRRDGDDRNISFDQIP